MLFAAGLALSGSRPVAAIYSTFLQRAFDQIIHDVCLQNLPVTFCMDRAGLVGDDGPTHHGVFDIAYLRALPNMTLMAPRDEAMLRRMLRTALELDGPAAIRYPRGSAAGVAIPRTIEPLEVGTGEILREGERVAVVGYGTGVKLALGAAELLAEDGLDVTVADARFAKPLDPGCSRSSPPSTTCWSRSRRACCRAASAPAVWEMLSEGGLTPRILRVGLPDRFVTHGAPSCCTRRSASPPSASPSASRPRSWTRGPRSSDASKRGAARPMGPPWRTQRPDRLGGRLVAAPRAPAPLREQDPDARDACSGGADGSDVAAREPEPEPEPVRPPASTAWRRCATSPAGCAPRPTATRRCSS